MAHRALPTTARVLAPLALGAALLAACTSAPRQRAYVAANDQTVVAATEEATGPQAQQIISLANRSTVPIVVYSVTLRSCENVRQACESPQKLDLKVAPGQRQILKRVSPRDPNLSFGYRYTFGWRVDSSATTAALGALADAGESRARTQLAAIEAARAEEASRGDVRDEVLEPAHLAAQSGRLARLRVEPESLVMKVGEAVHLNRFRLVAIGPAGERLGRVQQWEWRFQGTGAVDFQPPDSLVAVRAGRSQAEFGIPAATLPGAAPPAPARLTLIVRP